MISLNALSQILKISSQLVGDETNLRFPISMTPSEVRSDEDPPAWASRDEQWLIDGLLGMYDANEQRITLFSRGIQYVAAQLRVPEGWVEQIVRIHEWSHAIFHTGVDKEMTTELAKAFNENNVALHTRTVRDLTAVFNSVETYFHEQLAQSITWLSLERIYQSATCDEAKEISGLMIDAFQRLSKRQPPQYDLHKLKQLTHDQLRNRVGALIELVRSRNALGSQAVWDAIVSLK